MNESITQQSAALHPYLDNLQRYALVVGLVGLAATAVGCFTDEEQFFRSYLLAFTFWIGLPLGSLGILMIHHVGGGTWGFSIRRLLEAGTRTLPLLFVLSLPILFFGLYNLYEWARPEVLQKDSILQQKGSLSQASRGLSRALCSTSPSGDCSPSCSTAGRCSRTRRQRHTRPIACRS